MKILALNGGSSSLKFDLFETCGDSGDEETLKRSASGQVENFGAKARVVLQTGDRRSESNARASDCREALEIVFPLLTDKPGSPLNSLEEIDAVGHRFVHGGDEFHSSVVIDDDVLRRLESCAELAPLHAPANLADYRAAKALLPDRLHVAVFDTAFHQTMPERAWRYPLPRELCEKRRLRRYGFHGASHRYVHGRVAALLEREPEETSAITIHLGGGCSMAAIKNGRSIDTTMGFTPLEGLVMATRSGDIDPAVIPHIMEHENLSTHAVVELLNKRAGLAGMSGVPKGDMREVQRSADAGCAEAALAIDVYCYRVKKYIGAYMAALDGEVDAIAFAGGVGENSPRIRSLCCAGLERLGVRLDAERNAPSSDANAPKERRISAADSPIAVFAVPTDEGLAIAIDTARLLKELA
jgi:acetate kinase